MMQNKKMSLSPLQLMQRFYNDYNRRQSHASTEIPACKYARKKSSNTDKMTRFLMDQEKKNRGYSTITVEKYKNKTGQSSILSPSRYKESSSQASKRCYFKSSYSQSHPFLTSAHKIEQKNVDELKALKTEPIEYSSGAYQNLKLMSPMENRQIIKEMKDTMIRIKHFKKQKLDRQLFQKPFTQSDKSANRIKDQILINKHKIKNISKQQSEAMIFILQFSQDLSRTYTLKTVSKVTSEWRQKLKILMDSLQIYQKFIILYRIILNQIDPMNSTKRFLNLQFIVDIKNYKESFEKWMKIRSRNCPNNLQNKDQLFNKYLEVIKPIIHRFDYGRLFSHVVVSHFPHTQYGFYCHSLSYDQIQIVTKVFKPLKQYQILTKLPSFLISNQEAESTRTHKIELIQKYWKQIYRIDLSTKPSNHQLKWWGQGLDIKPIAIEGIVVTGKGEGRKNLGMPTANIELSLELQKKLDDYPNGVYLVDFDFVNGQSYRGAGCLGTNPHYQNFQESRRVQVYVIHDFGDDLFYDSKVVVTLRRLIRFEGKFHTFDAFLQAMHNDIYIADSLCPKHNAKNILGSL